MISAVLASGKADDGLYDGPKAWDLYTEHEDAVYEAVLAVSTCLDCDKCVRGEGEYGAVGWCKEFQMIVGGAETVAEHGCDAFE